MEDYYYESETNKGIRVEQSRAQLLSYRLINIFLASKPLHKLCDGEYNSGADILVNTFEKLEIENLMLQLAILLRTADTAVLNGKSESNRMNPVVGKLENISKGEVKNLDLREACNKIIHVEEIKYEFVDGEFDWERYLEPTIYLYGKMKYDKWKATLNMNEFCFAACHMPDW